MRTFLSYFLSPFSFFIVIFLASILLFLVKKEKNSLQVLLAGAIMLILSSTGIVANVFVKPLENKYNPLVSIPDSISDQNIYILVLGAGHTDDSRLPSTTQLSLRAKGRLMEGVRIFNILEKKKLVLSGYKGKSSISQARVAANAALKIGVDSSEIFLLKDPSNTMEEAFSFARELGSDQMVILVTDAIHMPRANYLFISAGLETIPAPTNFIIKEGTHRNLGLKPSINNIRNIEKALHEYVGLIVAMYEVRRVQREQEKRFK